MDEPIENPVQYAIKIDWHNSYVITLNSKLTPKKVVGICFSNQISNSIGGWIPNPSQKLRKFQNIFSTVI